ncbi:hypothetical protein ACFYOY_36110 [Streptomyces sp. NPDC007875]|uniref:hypothetical protein n=1 Tax=Streptomyces sp. NPDC007875 TaxID=3364783 RepID=UPI0036BE259C
MHDTVRTAEQIVLIEGTRTYVAGMGPTDLTSPTVVTGHLTAAKALLTQIANAFATGAADDVVRTADQAEAIEAVRVYAAKNAPVDTANVGQMVGHLMDAEGLLVKLVATFKEPATT